MSKKVELDMDCPRCKTAFKAALYRTIWIEYPENMELIMTDTINVVRCPACGLSEKQPFPFLATNAGKKVAVWYEPIPDRNIDSDAALYRKHFGDDYFLAKAERIKNWTEFKQRLTELNRGSDVNPTLEEFARLQQGMKSAYAEAIDPRQNSRISGLIASFRTWATKLGGTHTSTRSASPSSENLVGGASKRSIDPVNPITKLEQSISTWDRGQARIALVIFSAVIFRDRAPLEALFGKGAEVPTAIGRLTVGQLKILYEIMTEIAPDNIDGE
ncbi:MAG TPA: CpXC domain-containing protein [Acidobacteriaceae bacterium]|nr:CpXC domain-containing protein [Acidobacteriaceae bacterium]